VVGDADAVLIVGTYVFPEVFPLLDSPFRAGARVVHIDLNAYEVAKNFPADVALAADPAPTLAALAQRLSARGGPAGPAPAPGRRRAAGPLRGAPPPDAPLAEIFAAEVAAQAPADLIVFDEALTASGALTGYLPPRAPGSYFATRGGSLGIGIPGAIGAKLARPGAEVIGFTGDGGSMYTIQALWTAARHGIAARFVICNNGRYRLLDHNLDQYRAERGTAPRAYPAGFDLSRPPIGFTGIAAALGVPALRVAKPDQVPGAVRRMLASSGPFLIDLDTA
jgi:benzoylformate decarboxylase